MTRRIDRGIHPRNNFVKLLRLIYRSINRYARYEDIIFFFFELTVSRILFLEKIVFVIYILVFLVHIFMPVSTNVCLKIDLRFFQIPFFLENIFQFTGVDGVNCHYRLRRSFSHKERRVKTSSGSISNSLLNRGS